MSPSARLMVLGKSCDDSGGKFEKRNKEFERNQLRQFRIASHTKTALDLYNEMLAIYRERVNPAVLWYSAQAVKPGN